MQTDDEIGKLATATPVLMSRAIELFIQKLVSATHKLKQEEVSAEHRSKFMTVYDLQKCINGVDEYDFLRDFCADFIATLPEKPASKDAKASKDASPKRAKLCSEEEGGGADE